MPLLFSCADTKKQLNYAQHAKGNYDLGEEAFKAKDYTEAVEYFNQVRNKFPYSKYAVIAEVRAADALFEDEKYVEATEQYKMFLKMRPTNEKAPHAMFRIGMCSYYQMPKDWFFMPPVYEEDLTYVKSTIDAMQALVLRFPNAPEVKKAREVTDQCRMRLAKHEMYVAKFYFKDEKWQASYNRAKGLVDTYSNLGMDDEAMVIMAKCLVKLGRKEEARPLLERMELEFPNSKSISDARKLLKQIGPAPKPAPAPPSS